MALKDLQKRIKEDSKRKMRVLPTKTLNPNLSNHHTCVELKKNVIRKITKLSL